MRPGWQATWRDRHPGTRRSHSPLGGQPLNIGNRFLGVALAIRMRPARHIGAAAGFVDADGGGLLAPAVVGEAVGQRDDDLFRPAEIGDFRFRLRAINSAGYFLAPFGGAAAADETMPTSTAAIVAAPEKSPISASTPFFSSLLFLLDETFRCDDDAPRQCLSRIRAAGGSAAQAVRRSGRTSPPNSST